jgi:hypothetical protein
MNGPSRKSKPQTSEGTHSATSLLASGAGPSHSDSQGGLQLSLSGQDLAHASPSAQREGKGERLIDDTSGLSSSASLRSADLQLSLENRLRQRLEGRGSREYALTWKHWSMESGHPICALRASGHRISDNASTGWATPTANDAKGSQYAYSRGDHNKPVLKLPGQAQAAGWPTPSANQFEQNPEVWEARRQRNLAKGYNGNGQGATLDIAAHRAGWPTPNAADSWTPPHATENTMRRGDPNGTLRSTSGSLAKDVVMKVGWPTPTALDRPRTPETMAKSAAFRKRNANQNTVPLYLGEAAQLAHGGWPTPTARDSKGGYQGGRIRKGKISTDSLDVTAQLAHGQTPSASPALTAKNGVLNPEFVRWLMGFPEEWGNCVPTAMPSSRKSQRNS